MQAVLLTVSMHGVRHSTKLEHCVLALMGWPLVSRPQAPVEVSIWPVTVAVSVSPAGGTLLQLIATGQLKLVELPAGRAKGAGAGQPRPASTGSLTVTWVRLAEPEFVTIRR